MLGEFRLAQRGETLEVSCYAPHASVDGVALDEIDVEIFWGEGEVDVEEEGHRRTVRTTPGARVVETLPLPAPGTPVRAAARAVAGRHEGRRTLILALETQPPPTPPSELGARLLPEGVALSWQGPMPEAVEPPDLGPAGGAPIPFDDFFSRGSSRPAAEGSPEDTSPASAPESSAERPAPDASPESEGREPEAEGEPIEPRGLPEEEGVVEEDLLAEEPPRGHGFRIYRRRQSRPFLAPLAREPLDTHEFTDQRAPVGATVCYVVRAAGSVEPLIESAPSNEVCLAVRDITPPPPPTGLAVVPREGGLDVVWSPSPAADLGGYRVYRATGEGAAEVVAEVAAEETAWHDTVVRAGVLYRYTLTALDRAGNEGPPSGSAEGRPE
jgi:hypothetical protein